LNQKKIKMITKNYIKMCKKAEQIQKLWIPGLGDICINKTDNKEVMIVASRGKIIDKEYKFIYMGIGGREQRDYWHKKDQLVLLPTQEQLQEMMLPIFLKRFSTTHALRNDFSFIYRMIIEKFQRWINRSSPSLDEYMAMFSSLNELWLAFVMKEKYNKIWTRNDWQVKEEKK